MAATIDGADLLRRIDEHRKRVACDHTVIGDRANPLCMGAYKATWYCCKCGKSYVEIENEQERDLLREAAECLRRVIDGTNKA